MLLEEPHLDVGDPALGLARIGRPGGEASRGLERLLQWRWRASPRAAPAAAQLGLGPILRG
eukprot:5273992-Alexandrium_andersonii.AAC.1